jgi:selenocysteine-specific elongation factor
VIDPKPLHHRRRTETVTTALAALSSGELPELLAAEVRKQRHPIDRARLATLLNVAEEDIAAIEAGSLPEDLVVLGDPARPLFLSAAIRDRLAAGVLEALADHHREHPLSERGRTVEELMGPLAIERGGAADAALRLLLDALVRERRLKVVARTYALFAHRVELSESQRREAAFVERFLADQGMTTPSLPELTAAAAGAGIKERDVDRALRYLVEQGRAHTIEGEYLAAAVVDACRSALLGALADRTSGLTVAEFRDRVDGNRKICLLLFALFDREGLTRRERDARVLTDRGRAEAAAARGKGCR